MDKSVDIFRCRLVDWIINQVLFRALNYIQETRLFPGQVRAAHPEHDGGICFRTLNFERLYFQYYIFRYYLVLGTFYSLFGRPLRNGTM